MEVYKNEIEANITSMSGRAEISQEGFPKHFSKTVKHFGFGERNANCITYNVAQRSLLIWGSHIIHLGNYLMRRTI